MNRTERLCSFQNICIPHPQLKQIGRRFDEMREMVRATRGKQQKGGRILGPSGAGKSTIVKTYIASQSVASAGPEMNRPLVYVMPPTACTTKGLMESILMALGDPFASKGTENALRQRVNTYLTQLKTELVFIDEIQHLVGKAGDKTTWRVTESLKLLLDDGAAAFVFLGVEEAMEIFDRNSQLKNRMLKPNDMGPISANDDDQFNIFKGFVGLLRREMINRGVITADSVDLLDSMVIAGLHEAAGGLLGVAANIIEASLNEACDDGCMELEYDHVVRAVQNWAIPHGFTKHNPFN